jgi:hypothetical protein
VPVEPPILNIGLFNTLFIIIPVEIFELAV